MNMHFRDLSLGRKLMTLMMLTSSGAILLVCVVLFGYDAISSKRTKAEHLTSLARIVADNSKAALSFGDKQAASEVLTALNAEAHVRAAYILDKQFKPFASFRAEGVRDTSVPAVRNPGTYFESERTVQIADIELGDEKIGSVYIESDTAEVTQRYRQYGGILAAAVLLSWLLSLLVSSRLQRTISSPLNELIAVARNISDSGDLEHRIDADRKDEIGALAKSFSSMVAYLNEMAAASERIAGGDLSTEVAPRSQRDTLGNAFLRMTDGLRTLVLSVRESAAQVAGSSNQVASASESSARVAAQASSAIETVTGTMHEMGVSLQNLVRNTDMQASSVSETSASIEEMVASIQRVADNVDVLLDLSNRSRDGVQIGISSMEKATDGLNRINGSIHVSAEIIDSLGQRANEIGKILEVVDDLADQTNLLALNAAIEAARAGEHGLGFAVVADEVRKLAERSAQSAKEIVELIRSIQQEARSAVVNMEKSRSMVDEGLALGADLKAALDGITKVVADVNKFSQQIGAATKEQSHGSAQIAKAAMRLNQITGEITSSINEQSSGTEAAVNAMDSMRELVHQSSSSSAQLAASAEQMTKMAHTLIATMERFTLQSGVEERRSLAPQYAYRAAAPSERPTLGE